MSQEAELLKPLLFSFEGQSIPLLCNGDVELAFTSALEMRARDKIARRKKELGADYLMHLTIWQQRVDAEEYEWTGYTSFMARQSEWGKKKLLELMGRLLPIQVDKICADPLMAILLFNEDVGEDKPPLGLYWKALAAGRPTSPAPNTAAGKTQD